MCLIVLEVHKHDAFLNSSYSKSMCPIHQFHEWYKLLHRPLQSQSPMVYHTIAYTCFDCCMPDSLCSNQSSYANFAAVQQLATVLGNVYWIQIPHSGTEVCCCSVCSSITNNYSAAFWKCIHQADSIWHTIENNAILSSSYFLPCLRLLTHWNRQVRRNCCWAAKWRVLVQA